MDRTTKVLLFLIAAALWLDLLMPAVSAQSDDLQRLVSHLTAISEGLCLNAKICG